jgi:radical SAM superfamily enzyme YgiQ (UPF0313 family)
MYDASFDNERMDDFWDINWNRVNYPDIVGFYVTTPTLFNTLKMVKILRHTQYAVFGGPHMSACRMPELESRGEVIRGEVETYDKLDEIPHPAWELLPWKQYRGQPILGNRTPIGVVHTSRGCPYACKFCYKSIYGRTIKFHSPERVLEEILRWKSAGAEEFTINDDAFITSEERVHKICNLLIREKVNLPWTCSNGIRCGDATREVLQHMRAAGCYRVALGIESGNQAVLDAMNKRLTLQEVKWAVDNCKAAHIKTVGFFMLGLPWDTLLSMEQTIDFACSLPLDFAQFSIATPYPGTELYDLLRSDPEKYVMKNIPFARYNIYTGAFFYVSGCFSLDDVTRLRRKAYRRFYWRASQITKHILDANNWSRFLKGAWTFMR